MDEYTKDSIYLIREDIKEMKKDVKALLHFRAVLLGYAAAISAAVSILVAIFFKA